MFTKKQDSQTMSQRYQTDECLICFKNKYNEIDLMRLFEDGDPLCQQCRKSLNVVNKRIEINNYQCLAIYEYNKFFQQLLIQYKELYDEALYSVFLYPFKEIIEREYKKYTLVYVPSTQEKKEERGFDHLEKMFSIINLKKEHIFEKEKTNDQKKSNYQKRQEVKEYIRLTKNIDEIKSPILLVDDVITTGASLKACLNLLVNHKYPIKILVVSCNHSYLKE